MNVYINVMETCIILYRHIDVPTLATYSRPHRLMRKYLRIHRLHDWR